MANCSSNTNGNHGKNCDTSCRHKGDKEKQIDELMETLWDLREKGKVTLSHMKESGAGQVILENLSDLCSGDLVMVQDNHIRLTVSGEKRARDIVRRHRLSERMLRDLFDIPEGQLEGTSCEFEHILSQEVTDSICAFLGHPTHCPHGRPIPRGECCDRLDKIIRPLVMPLTDLEPGERGRISFISFRDKGRLQRLSSLGIIPGGVVTMNQKMPAFVISAGETDIALDRSIVEEIYVKRIVE